MSLIALLGAGRMGTGMGISILRSGYALKVWNRTAAKANRLVELGAMQADTPAEAVSGARYVIAMLSDDAAAEEVWLGKEGALGNVSEGAFIIECSTLSLPLVLGLSDIAARKKLRYIDCPVTGPPSAAENGALTLLVGAGAADLEECKPVLQLFSNTIRYFGDVGKGTSYKLLINLMGAVQIAALAEGIAMAEKLGLDRETVVSAIENSAAASPQVIKHAAGMAARQFAQAPSFTVGLREKDASYALALAESIGYAPRLGRVARDCFTEAKQLGYDADEASVVSIM